MLRWLPLALPVPSKYTYICLRISPASVAYARENRGSGKRLSGLIGLEMPIWTGLLKFLTTALEREAFDIVKTGADRVVNNLVR